MDNIERYKADINRATASAGDRQLLIMQAYATDGTDTSGARALLIRSLLWLPFGIAVSKAARSTWYDADTEDLIQAGNIAMMTAIDSWNPTGGAKLTTWIRWACLRDMTRENARARAVPGSDYPAEEYNTVEGAAWADAQGDEPFADIYKEFMEDEDSAIVPKIELWEANNEIRGAVLALDTELRQVIEFLFFDGLSLRSAAEKMKISHTKCATLRDIGLRELNETLRAR